MLLLSCSCPTLPPLGILLLAGEVKKVVCRPTVRPSVFSHEMPSSVLFHKPEEAPAESTPT